MTEIKPHEENMAEPVYRNYDSESLYAQYDNRSMLPAEELAAIKADQADRSNAYRDGAKRLHLDVPYGPHERERLDLFLPDSEGAPLFAFIHGGYWQWNDKEDSVFLAKPFVEAGAAFANIEYALCPTVSLDELVAQVRRAIAYLWREADKYGYDRNRIVVSGHSAGGHLTAMMMSTDWPALGDDLPANIVAAGLPISGVYDIEPLRLTPLNEAVGLTEDSAQANSPLFKKPASNAPAIIAYGGAESDEFERQANALASAWAKEGAPTEVINIEGRNHFTALNALAETDAPLYAAALRLLGLAH